jgi:hypothetical protein
MWSKLSIAISVALMAAIGIAAPAGAATGDRPTGVASVKPAGVLTLHSGGTITGAVKVRCQPGWMSSDVDAIIGQGESVSTSTDTTTDLPCDKHWHAVALTFGPGLGTFKPGKVTYAFLQFLVFNNESGDPAAGHDNGATTHLRAA